MSLNYNLQGIADGVVEENSTLTEAMIFLTMHIGWGEITEQNAAQWYARVHVWEQTYGTMLRVRDEDDPDHMSPRPITPEDVRKFIGLTTNVFGHSGAKQESDAAFNKRLMKFALEDAAAAYHKAVG